MSVILLWIVRVLVVLFILRLVLRWLGIGQRVPAARPHVRERVRSGGTLVQDPQCGTYLPKSRALMVGAAGETKYFCSPACRDAYAAGHRT